MTVELDLKDYLRILKKRLWLILTFIAVACVTAGLVSYFVLTPVYEASTKIIVNKSGDTPTLDTLNINDVNLNIRLIDTYKEIIKTHAIMDKVAKEHPEFGLTGEQLIAMVSVSAVNNSQVMTVKMQDPSYQKAADMVNAISVVFQREIASIFKVDNVTLLNEADRNLNPAPVKPHPVLNIAIAFVLSAMVGVGVIFLLEFLDDTIKTEQDVASVLGVPVLAVVARVKDEDLRNSSKLPAAASTSPTRKAGEQHVTFNQ